MNKITLNKHLIRFRRWIRKGYAMFASVGKCVTIGYLRKGIADQSLGKQLPVCVSTFIESFLWKEDPDAEPADIRLALNNLEQSVLLLQPAPVAEELRIYIYNSKKFGPKGCIRHLFGLFYV